MNAILQSGNYLWSLNIFEYHEDIVRNYFGKFIFAVDIDKEISDKNKECNTINPYELTSVLQPVAAKPSYGVVNVDIDPEETQPKYLGLIPALKAFMEKYPAGTRVDPVRFTLEFLNVINEN